MKKWLSFFGILCMAIAVCLLLAVLKESAPYVQAGMDYNRIRKEYVILPGDLGSGVGSDRRIDFGRLREINADIVAWIYIPGTQIDYPICQAKGEAFDYYLSRNIYRQENILGALFIGPEQSEDFVDRHTVVYGHNMESGQMFGELSNYSQQRFRDAHPYVYIYTPDCNMVFQIYCAFKCASDSEVYRTKFDSEEEYVQWMEKISGAGAYSGVQEPAQGVQLITLSTCTAGNENERFVVQCRKIKTDKGGF